MGRRARGNVKGRNRDDVHEGKVESQRRGEELKGKKKGRMRRIVWREMGRRARGNMEGRNRGMTCMKGG